MKAFAASILAAPFRIATGSVTAGMPSLGTTNSTGEPFALALNAMKSTRTPCAFSPPATDFSTRQPYPDARRVLDAGARIAIATNCNPGSSYTTSMAFCLALAVRDMGLTIEEADRSLPTGELQDRMSFRALEYMARTGFDGSFKIDDVRLKGGKTLPVRAPTPLAPARTFG